MHVCYVYMWCVFMCSMCVHFYINMCLNMQPLVVGVVCNGCGMLRRLILVEDVCHWGWAFRLYKLVPFYVQSLLPDCECNVTNQTPYLMLCLHVFPS